MGGQNLKPPSKQSLNGHSIMMLFLVLIVFFTPRHATAGVFSDLSTYVQDNSFAEYDSYERNPYYAMGQNNSAIEYLLFNPDSYFVFDQRSDIKLGLTKRHSFAMTPMTLDLDYEDASKGKDSLLRWDDLGVTEADTGKFTSLEFMPAETWFIGGEYQKIEGAMTGNAQARQRFGFFFGYAAETEFNVKASFDTRGNRTGLIAGSDLLRYSWLLRKYSYKINEI